MSAALKLPLSAPLADAPETTLLHLVTCGSVDDGKSTLLGRLLFDSNAVLDDQLTALDRDSKRFGTLGEARDYSLLVDGLSAEREQGITIDIAYRYFSTPRRSFILADAPGHEQYTRNMATGASRADLAIILIDARKGVLPQTRRHSYIVGMLGVRNVVLAVNKMDLVGFAKDTYERIVADYRAAVASLGFTSISAIPICAREGDNVVTRSTRMPWYEGPALLEHLETVPAEPESDTAAGFRFPVQLVSRPNLDFRGYAGTISSGVVYAHQPVIVLPGGGRSRIASIVTADGELASASSGQAVTLTLTDEIDVSRGDVIVPADTALTAASEITARVLWMVEQPLTIGQNLLIKIGAATANVRVASLYHAIDIHSFATRPASSLAMNEIGVAELVFDKKLAAATYAADRELGALVLIDRMTTPASAADAPTETMPAVAVEGPAVAPVTGRNHATDRIPFWASISGRVLSGATLAVLVAGVSGDLMLAAGVGIADMVLCPVLTPLIASAWTVRTGGD